MITVANCFDMTEVFYIRMLLESAGIEVFVPDEMTATLAPHYFLSNTGIRVQVADEQVSEARRIIEEAKSDQKPDKG